jgi:carbon monoxide dehydrogenase subunit G
VEIKNEFTVTVPIDRAWAVLTDLALVASCLPGAQVTGQEGDTYLGKVRIKVGPVVSEYAGTAAFTMKDDANYRAVIEAKGRSSSGAGNASANESARRRREHHRVG